MDGAKEIGLRIRQIRDRKGMSQKDLAKALRISSGYLSQMELGDRNIDATMLLGIAKELKTPVQDFYPDNPLPEKVCGKEIAKFEHAGHVLVIYED